MSLFDKKKPSLRDKHRDKYIAQKKEEEVKLTKKVVKPKKKK